MTGPLVSVITPTWNRHEALLTRCVPSVAAQTYPHVEHIVVSDGPDAVLADLLRSRHPVVRYGETAERGGHWGHDARLAGIAMAEGDLVAWLDDDDSYRPDHVAVLAAALGANPGADFAYSKMLSHSGDGETVIGADPPFYGGIGTPMIMSRRSLLDAVTWERSMPSIDWDLVERWLAAGAAYVALPDVTVDVWPSAYW